MATAKDITAGLGRGAVRKIALSVGRSEKTVRNKLCGAEPRFPAAWFPPIKDLCEGAGVDCPMSAFAFRVAEGV